MSTRRQIRSAGWAGIAALCLSLVPYPFTGRMGKFLPYWSDSTDSNEIGSVTGLSLAERLSEIRFHYSRIAAYLIRRPFRQFLAEV